MARIRSVHPGLPTDEAFMSMSAFAKAAWPLLWTECDDQGVFEWKPIVLKARILPADNVGFADLLNEWESLGCVVRFDVGGKSYGAVRNFQKFQRPKKPNKVHPLPSEFRTFVASADDSSEPVPNSEGTSPKNPPQMEDGGGRREEKDIEPCGSRPQPTSGQPSDPSEIEQAFELWNATAERLGLPKASKLNQGRKARLRARLREHGLDGWRKALSMLAMSPHCLGQNDRGWRADLDFLLQDRGFLRLIEGAYANRQQVNGGPSPPGTKTPEAEWRQRVANWQRDRRLWHGQWGGEPGEPGCLAPAHILAEFNIQSKHEVAACSPNASGSQPTRTDQPSH